MVSMYGIARFNSLDASGVKLNSVNKNIDANV